jgi:hypothetical protein
MPPPSDWRRIIANYDCGYIASNELVAQLSRHAEVVAPGDYDDIVAALRSHASDHVRTTLADNVVELVTAARKEIDYAAERALLAPWLGSRAEVFGGYAFYHGDQPWLAGRTHHEGTVTGELKVADDRPPVAVIQLDADLDLSAMSSALRGGLLLLSLRYRGDTWESGEGVALAYLFDQLPAAEEWSAVRDVHELESHASFRFLRA